MNTKRLKSCLILSICAASITALMPSCTTVVSPTEEPTVNTTSTTTRKTLNGYPTSSTETRTTQSY